ncbi:CAP domain-containing protein [Deinococcus taeanensis]|uniref:CAP domain-containing protein n=1 Tax=Deinococcus taeanensis TaxID=2737050 RepID=UPI001CDBBEAC|nr:CAP domain-containing protein [Deinococcus taeanensis]UBV42025.1 CAP domain-containing protein [Deinococcus taeanensis]
MNGQPAQPGQLQWTTSQAAVVTAPADDLVTGVGAGPAKLRAALVSTPSIFLEFPVTVTASAPALAPAAPPSFVQMNAAPALALNSLLSQAAQGHAADMAARNFFSSTSQDGRTFAHRGSWGHAVSRAGENMAAGRLTAQEVVGSWLKRPGHCANIMNASFRELGVGYTFRAGSTYRPASVQGFGTC